VIVVGAGLTGLATALSLARNGVRVLVLEASELVGGAAAFSGGQVWVGANHVAAAAGYDDDLARVARYVRAIGSGDPGHLDESAMVRWLTCAPEAARYWEALGAVRWQVIPELPDYHRHADGATQGGRYLTAAPTAAEDLGDWLRLLRISPYFPVGKSYAEMLREGRRRSLLGQGAAGDAPAFGRAQRGSSQPLRTPEVLTFGPGVVAGFLREVIGDPRIRLSLSTRVTGLVANTDGVVRGVRTENAEREHRVEDGPVVLATSTFDWNPDLVREFLGLEPDDFGSVAPTSLRGDAVTLARSVGGDVARLPATSTPMKPGWRAENETGFAYGPEYAMPHSFIVDETGSRFCDDSYWVDIIEKVMDPVSPRRPFFLIWDSRHHQRYGLGETPPGGVYAGPDVRSASSLSELATELGINAPALVRTAAAFSENARKGVDPDFGRGSVPYVSRFVGDPDSEWGPVLGPVDEPPYFGMRMRLVSTGIGSSGVRIDGDGRVLDGSGTSIPGLYAVGSCAALTTSGSGYNSGFALGRGLTLAYLVAHELAGVPVPYPHPRHRRIETDEGEPHDQR